MARLRTNYLFPIFTWLIVAIAVLAFVLVTQFIYEANECIEQWTVARKLDKLFGRQQRTLLSGFIRTKKKKNVATVTPNAPDLEFDGSEDEHPKGKLKQKKLPIQIDLVDVTWNFETFRDWEEERNDIEMIDIDEDDNLKRIAMFVAKTIDRLSKNLAKGT